MRPLRNLIREARALGLLRPLAGNALAMALVFGALAMAWIATPGASAHPSLPPQPEAPALANPGVGR
jgi:hypothetical protein